MSTKATRTEHDLLGDKEVPAEAYYGVQTARALENVHISGVEPRLYPNLIKAFAMVKLAAEAMKTGREILELLREKKILSEEQIAKVLDPAAMTGQGRPS